MKVFLRVVVTILILTGLGFGVYFIFFKPAGDDVVFLKLSEVMDYKKSNGEEIVGSKIGKIYSWQTDSSGKIDNKYKAEECNNNCNLLCNGNAFELEISTGETETEKVNVLSCRAMDVKLNGIFQYYFAYTQASKNVSKNAQKDITKSIKEYKKAYDELITKLDSVISMQTTAEGGYDENYALELKNRYYNAITSYRACLKNYSDLILKVKEFVIKYVFDNAIINDKEIASKDILLYTIKSAVSSDFGAIGDNGYDDNRISSLKLLNDVYTFSALKIGGNVVVVKAGSVISGTKVYTPKLTVVNDASQEKALIIDAGNNEYYRKDTDGKWWKCDPNSYVIPTDENKKISLMSAVDINVDSFYNGQELNEYIAPADGETKETTSKAIEELKVSKFVESYTYVVNNGYLDELITILTHSQKSRFMKNPTGFSIVDICVPSLQYILACYGFCIVE